MKILLPGLCWTLAASVISLAVFGSYFKISSGSTSPKTSMQDQVAAEQAEAPQASGWAAEKVVAPLLCHSSRNLCSLLSGTGVCRPVVVPNAASNQLAHPTPRRAAKTGTTALCVSNSRPPSQPSFLFLPLSFPGWGWHYFLAQRGNICFCFHC